MELKHKSYSDIENSYRTAYTDKLVETGNTSGKWVVTEKIHGCNFQFNHTGNEILIGSRSDFVDTTFYGCKEVVTETTPKVEKLYSLLKRPFIVFGELFGAGVQKGIFYTTKKNFYAFDIYFPSLVEGEKGEYMQYDEVIKLLKECNFFYAEPLFIGTLEECLAYENDYNSTIPSKLGEVSPEINICEGNVIKPYDNNKYFGNGSRIILKNKNDKWSEKAHAKTNAPKIKPTIELSELANTLLNELLSFATENRIKNVLSKMGEVTNKDFGKINGLFNQDTLKDFSKEFGVEFDSLTKEEQKYLTSTLNNETTVMIRKNFLSIIDKTF